MNYNLVNLEDMISTYISSKKPGLILNRLIFLGCFPNGKSYYGAILIDIGKDSNTNNTVEILEKGKNNEVRTLISNSGISTPLSFYFNGQIDQHYVKIENGVLIKLVPEGTPEFTDVFISDEEISNHKEIDAKGVVVFLPDVDDSYKELLKSMGYFEIDYSSRDKEDVSFQTLLTVSKLSNLIIGTKKNEDLGKELNLETGVPFLSMSDKYDLYNIKNFVGISFLSTYCQKKIKG